MGGTKFNSENGNEIGGAVALNTKPPDMRIDQGRIRPEWPIWIGIVIAIIALLAGGVSLYSSLDTMAAAQRASFTASALMNSVRNVEESLQIADDALDGYVESGDASFLERNRRALEDLQTNIAALHAAALSPDQLTRVNRIEQLVSAQRTLFAEREAAARDGPRRSEGIFHRMMTHMEEINQATHELRSIELERLEQAGQIAIASQRTAGWVLAVSAVLTVMLMIASTALFRGELKLREQNEARAQEMNRILEQRVSERTEQLAAAARQLEKDAGDLRQTNDRLKQILLHSPLGIMHFDSNLRLIAWSPACESLYGYSADEMLGLSIADVARHTGADPAEKEALGRGVLAGQPLEASIFQRRRKNGQAILVRMWGARYGADAEAADGFVFLVEDITERAALEERLQLGEYTIASASVGIALTARDAQIMRANPSLCRLLGYSETELRALRVADVNPSLADGWESHWAELRQRGSMTFESELRHRDGHLIPVEIDTSLHEFRGREVKLSFIRDMTVRRQIERQLIQSQKLESVGQLAGGVAHDFNNLLAIVMGNIERAIESAGDNGELREPLTAAMGAAQRGAELTHQMLAFSRKQPLKPRAVDVRDSIEQLNALLSRTLGETIAVQLKLAKDLWLCHVDPTQLESSIVNLAVNGRDAMPRGGRLTIAAYNRVLDEDYVAANPDARAGDFVCIEVTDTGAGMSEEVLARVFEPFFTTKPAGKGTGLGLSMVYGFVRQSGGHVKIYSEVGEGTTVRVYLPAVGPARTVDTAVIATASPEPDDHARILVVEDDENVRQVTCSQLKRLGYEVVEAADGPSALKILLADPSFDLLFTDVVMRGGMSGVELCAVARRMRPDLPVLLTSGFPDVGQAGFPVGPDDLLLSKPYRRHELAAKIREALSRRRGTA